MSAGFLNHNAYLPADLVFRVPHENSPQRGYELRSRRRELVLGHIPGKRIERGPRLRRLRPLLITTSGDPVRRRVLGIALAPRRLRRRPPPSPTLRLRTDALPCAYPNVRDEPAAAEPARTRPEHPRMLPGGSLLASNPGLLLASARGPGGRKMREVLEA